MGNRHIFKHGPDHKQMIFQLIDDKLICQEHNGWYPYYETEYRSVNCIIDGKKSLRTITYMELNHNCWIQFGKYYVPVDIKIYDEVVMWYEQKGNPLYKDTWYHIPKYFLFVRKPNKEPQIIIDWFLKNNNPNLLDFLKLNKKDNSNVFQLDEKYMKSYLMEKSGTQHFNFASWITGVQDDYFIFDHIEEFHNFISDLDYLGFHIGYYIYLFIAYYKRLSELHKIKWEPFFPANLHSEISELIEKCKNPKFSIEDIIDNCVINLGKINTDVFCVSKSRYFQPKKIDQYVCEESYLYNCDYLVCKTEPIPNAPYWIKFGKYKVPVWRLNDEPATIKTIFELGESIIEIDQVHMLPYLQYKAGYKPIKFIQHLKVYKSNYYAYFDPVWVRNFQQYMQSMDWLGVNIDGVYKIFNQYKKKLTDNYIAPCNFDRLLTDEQRVYSNRISAEVPIYDYFEINNDVIRLRRTTSSFKF